MTNATGGVPKKSKIYLSFVSRCQMPTTTFNFNAYIECVRIIGFEVVNFELRA